MNITGYGSVSLQISSSPWNFKVLKHSLKAKPRSNYFWVLSLKGKKGNKTTLASFDDVTLVRGFTMTCPVSRIKKKKKTWCESLPFHPLLFFLVFLRHNSGSCVSVTGLPDPFAKVVVDGSGQCHSTDTVKSTLDPKWNQHYDLWVQNNERCHYRHVHTHPKHTHVSKMRKFLFLGGKHFFHHVFDPLTL